MSELDLIHRRMDGIEEENRKQTDLLSKIDKTLAVQAEQLKQHIYRTRLAEENIELLREEVKPIKKHIIMMDGVVKFLGLISLATGVIAGILQFFKG